MFYGQRVVVVSVVKVDWIFQVHLQYQCASYEMTFGVNEFVCIVTGRRNLPFGPVTVHGVDVEIFGVVEKTKFSYGQRLGKRESVKVVRV